MSRLIDADALIKAIDSNPFTTDSVKSYIRVSVAKMPTHDATTLMQENINMRKIFHERVRNGRWEKIGVFLDGETVICSKCGEKVILNERNRERYNFCPNCGSDMREKQDA